MEKQLSFYLWVAAFNCVFTLAYPQQYISQQCPADKLKRIVALLPGFSKPDTLTACKRDDGSYLWGSDLLIDQSQVLRELADSGGTTVVYALINSLVAILYDAYWDDGIIPYQIDASIPEPVRKDIILAMREINEQTNLCLVRRKTSDEDFIEFKLVRAAGECGRSRVGRVGEGQVVELNDGWGCNHGTVMHEILHAAGFHHEHQRADRAPFVTINRKRMCMKDVDGNSVPISDSEFAIAFDSLPDDIPFGPYDFKSIMHYPKSAFSCPFCFFDDCVTIQTLNGEEIGKYDKLSDGDIAAIKHLYPAKCPNCGEGRLIHRILEIEGFENEEMETDIIFENRTAPGFEESDIFEINQDVFSSRYNKLNGNWKVNIVREGEMFVREVSQVVPENQNFVSVNALYSLVKYSESSDGGRDSAYLVELQQFSRGPDFENYGTSEPPIPDEDKLGFYLLDNIPFRVVPSEPVPAEVGIYGSVPFTAGTSHLQSLFYVENPFLLFYNKTRGKCRVYQTKGNEPLEAPFLKELKAEVSIGKNNNVFEVVKTDGAAWLQYKEPNSIKLFLRIINPETPFEEITTRKLGNRETNKLGIKKTVWRTTFRGARAIKVFRFDNEYYLFVYRERDGRVWVYKIDQTPSRSEPFITELVARDNWRNSWKTFDFFEEDNRIFLLHSQ